jgi:hypothetical protein
MRFVDLCCVVGDNTNKGEKNALTINQSLLHLVLPLLHLVVPLRHLAVPL